MTLTSLYASNRYWRIFATISFLNQIVRVPLLLSLANSVKDLEVYFVISATSIPIQFIAQDILQYRNKALQLQPLERIGLPLFACVSIIYVAFLHGFEIGCTYLIFSVSIVLHGASIGYLRELFPAKIVLAIDALYHTGTTLMAVAFVVLIKDGTKLGHYVILSQALMAFTISVLNLLIVRHYRLDVLQLSKVATTNSIRHRSNTPLILISLMVVTQLERLIISASQPVVLVCISLAAGVCQAWRKVGMDDAIVFERLRYRHGEDLYEAMYSELIKARLVFYTPLIFAIIACVLINDIAIWFSTNGLLRSLDQSIYVKTAAIVCIYLAAMPPAIVSINTLRQRVVPLHKIGWGALILLGIAEIGVLTFPHALVEHTNLAMVAIILNAGLCHVLFLASCPVPLSKSFFLLRFDIAVFIFIISLLTWMKFL